MGTFFGGGLSGGEACTTDGKADPRMGTFGVADLLERVHMDLLDGQNFFWG